MTLTPSATAAGAKKPTFVQENGSINDLPGNPGNAEINQQADNDYYFCGGLHKHHCRKRRLRPVGVLCRATKEAAERAFAGNDNDLRYHFNLPSTLSLTNQVAVTFDYPPRPRYRRRGPAATASRCISTT